MFRVVKHPLPWIAVLAAVGLGSAHAVVSPNLAVLSSDLTRTLRAKPLGRIPVIVQTTQAPTPADFRAPVRSGGRVTAAFSQVRGFAAELPVSAIYNLTRQAGVVHISRDLPVAAYAKKLPKGGVYGGWDDASRAVGADQAWNARFPTSGAGVGVAVLDTGVAPVRDLTVYAFKDFVNKRPTAYDDNGHGTHVAGIVAGNGAMSGLRNSHFLGVAPGVRLVGVKVLDDQARGMTSAVIQGLDWCIANKNAYNLRVINLSLGQTVAESYKTDPLCQAAERAVAAGIVVVVSAGNHGDGYGGIQAPGNDPNVITVGASRTNASPRRSDDAVAGFTSRGPTAVDTLAKPDVLAPGNRIVSLRAPGSRLDRLYPGNRVAPYTYDAAGDAQYFVLSGTSMAAPVVSGIAALIAQKRPDLCPNAVKAAIMVSAQPVGGFDPVLNARVARYDWMTVGAGYVNAIGAVKAANTLQNNAVLPDPNNPNVPEGWGYDQIQGEPVDWGNVILWGNNVVPSGNAWNFKNVRWDRSVLWGDSGLWSSGLVPESDAVETTCVLWGSNPLKSLGGESIAVHGDPTPAR